MAELENQQTQNKKVKKSRYFLVKIIFFAALVFFAYFAIQYWYVKGFSGTKHAVLDNGDIFDFEASKDGEAIDLSDMTVDELREKGAEFIYQMLLKNQMRVNELKTQIQDLRAEFTKYKNQEKIGKIIFAYMDLRQKVFAGENYNNALQSFELASSFDKNLQGELTKLRPLLKDFAGVKKLAKNFDELIPQLMALKRGNPEADFASKVRYQIAKIIVVRRIDEKNPKEIDAVIVRAQKLLVEENYQESLQELLALDQKYNQVLKSFLNDLSNAIEVQRIDLNILNYLKNLS